MKLTDNPDNRKNEHNCYQRLRINSMKDSTEIRKNDIAKVLNIWDTKNKIIQPNIEEDLRNIFDHIASFFAAGTFYYYVFNFQTLEMDYVHESVRDVLGIKPDEFNLKKLFSLYHPDDLARMYEKENAASEFLFNIISPEDIPFYKVVYVTRFKDQSGNYKKILHQAKAINVTTNGKIQQVLGVHTDITYLNTPIDHKISFIGETRRSYFALDPCNLIFEENDTGKLFTNQELKIIQLISEGKNSNEIAELLFITYNTLKTHKKNIFRKSNSNNSGHLIMNCILDGII